MSVSLPTKPEPSPTAEWWRVPFDPEAEPFSQQRPGHQSWFSDGSKYRPDGGGTWLATPAGTAWHEMLEVSLKGGDLGAGVDYVRKACRDCERPIRTSGRWPSQRAAGDIITDWHRWTLDKLRARNLQVLASEAAFLWRDQETGWWYEGWIDLVAMLDGLFVVADGKTGSSIPGPLETVQPDIYCCGAGYGFLAHAPRHAEHWACDWLAAEPINSQWQRGLPTFNQWPYFEYIHVGDPEGPRVVPVTVQPEQALKRIREATAEYMREWNERRTRTVATATKQEAWLEWCGEPRAEDEAATENQLKALHECLTVLAEHHKDGEVWVNDKGRVETMDYLSDRCRVAITAYARDWTQHQIGVVIDDLRKWITREGWPQPWEARHEERKAKKKAPKVTKDANLYQRLMQVQQDVNGLRKERKKGLQYDIISHDQVTSHCRRALMDAGIHYSASIAEWKQDGDLCSVLVDVTFTNVDDPEDRLTVRHLGQGVDKQDKGPGKAMSYAVKYALMKTLALETGEDADLHHDSNRDKDFSRSRRAS